MPASRVRAVTNVQRTERSRPADTFDRSRDEKIKSAGGAEAEPQISLTKGSVIYASIVAFVAWTLSVYDFILFGILLPVVAKDFGWSTEFSTLVATWVSVGTFVVAIAVGPIVDYLGRRTALVVTTAVPH